MALEFELKKITPTIDDDPSSSSSSTSELQLARGTATPCFCSNETNTMFILTAKLTGFAKEDIVITINGSGSEIEIGWGKPVQEMEISRWVYMKQTEMRRFKKIFRIPEGVILDEIKATYNDEESILKVLMPKSVNGILGVGIEEVKEQDSEAEKIPEMTAELETLETGRKAKLVADNHWNEEEDAANGVVEGENERPQAFPKREYVAETLPKETDKLKSDEMEDIDGVSNDYTESDQLEKATMETAEYEATRRQYNEGIAHGEIKVPEVQSMEGIEVAEGALQGTGNRQKEKGEPNAEAHNGRIATMKNKQPDSKTQSKAAVDKEAQVWDRELSQPNRQTQAALEIVEPGKQETYKNVWELKELETDKEPEEIESPYLQRSAHENEEKGVGQQGKSCQTKDEIKEAREEARKSPQRETHEDSRKPEAKQGKKQDSKQFKISTPLIIAGSTLLASLVTIVFNFVRSKRREKNMSG